MSATSRRSLACSSKLPWPRPRSSPARGSRSSTYGLDFLGHGRLVRGRDERLQPPGQHRRWHGVDRRGRGGSDRAVALSRVRSSSAASPRRPGPRASASSYNWYPAQILLGDAGSFFVGFILASAARAQAPAGGPMTMTGLDLLLSPALFDTALVVVSRPRAGRSVFVGGDRPHVGAPPDALGLGNVRRRPRWPPPRPRYSSQRVRSSRATARPRPSEPRPSWITRLIFAASRTAAHARVYATRLAHTPLADLR